MWWWGQCSDFINPKLSLSEHGPRIQTSRICQTQDVAPQSASYNYSMQDLTYHESWDSFLFFRSIGGCRFHICLISQAEQGGLPLKKSDLSRGGWDHTCRVVEATSMHHHHHHHHQQPIIQLSFTLPSLKYMSKYVYVYVCWYHILAQSLKFKIAPVFCCRMPLPLSLKLFLPGIHKPRNPKWWTCFLPIIHTNESGEIGVCQPEIRT